MPNQPGTLWTVFELSGDITHPQITIRNTMGLAEDPAGINIPAPATDAGVIEHAVRTDSKKKMR